MQLAEFAEPLAYELAVGLQAFDASDSPLPELGRLSIDLSLKFRVLGIVLLVAKANSEGFHQNLARSALVRYKYLRLLAVRGITGEHHQSAGRYEALTDAVACGAWEIAEKIERYSPKEWNEGHEYECDFCYGTLLGQLATRSKAAEPLLARFERTLEDAAKTRLEIVRSLAGRDQQLFDESFEQFLTERANEIEENRKRGQAEEYWVIAERRVSVEGLALLRLASRVGLSTKSAYVMCPMPARGTPPAKFAGL